MQAHLALDARAALGLLKAHLLLAHAGHLLVLDAADAILFLADAALFRLADGALGGGLRGALGVDAGLGVFLLLLDAPVLDVAELFQRKEDGVLTTLGHCCPFLRRSR